MKICISSTGKNIDATVDLRFGRCQYFLIVDTTTMNIKTLSNEAIRSSGGAGIQAAQNVTKEGIDAVITGNIGPNAFQILQAANIEIYTGAQGTIQEIIEKYKKGKLQQTHSANVKSHSGIGGSK
ncbi:MAG: NifB/NifX family molybdenum-iron cluster-binding protein [Thermoplasmatota archaeon]